MARQRAGFFALGMAKASGRPEVLTCTSGTAVPLGRAAALAASEMRMAGACEGGPVHVNFPFDEALRPDMTASSRGA